MDAQATPRDGHFDADAALGASGRERLHDASGPAPATPVPPEATRPVDQVVEPWPDWERLATVCGIALTAAVLVLPWVGLVCTVGGVEPEAVFDLVEEATRDFFG